MMKMRLNRVITLLIFIFSVYDIGYNILKLLNGYTLTKIGVVLFVVSIILGQITFMLLEDWWEKTND